jgi:hypothetical protein
MALLTGDISADLDLDRDLSLLSILLISFSISILSLLLELNALPITDYFIYYYKSLAILSGVALIYVELEVA